ncbi:DinB family protein [Rufibacter sp. DG15C]|uniref:DinB family protein n=1 Tax=Rufibacter sp. DG15C TaxID=1379909 RepID=UPI0012F73C66|nr:DinB family protein [Rufibacter sp. DG15C]
MQTALQAKFDRLEQQRQAYTSQLNSLTPAQQAKKPAEDQWSAAQLYYHLWKVEQVVIQSIKDNMASDRKRRPISFNTRWRSFLLNMFLILPTKLKVPKVIGEMPETVNPMEVEKNWQDTRNTLQQFLTDFPAELLDKEIFKHPRAGVISLGQTLDFLIEHANHHKRQMKSLLP